MSLPPSLRSHKGKMLQIAAITADKGLSIVGTKTLLLTDIPGVLLHDTGGLLGEEKTLKKEPVTEQDLSLIACKRSRQLKGRVVFNARIQATFEVTKKVEKCVTGLSAGRQRIPHAVFDSIIPISIVCRFSLDDDALQKRMVEHYRALLKTNKRNASEIDDVVANLETQAEFGADWFTFYDQNPDATPELLVLAEHLQVHECYVRIVVADGRLRLLKNNSAIADLPVRFLNASKTSEREITIKTETTVAGQIVKDFKIMLTVPAQAQRLVSVLQKDAGQTDAAHVARSADVVHLKGRLQGTQTVDEQVDALLGETAIEFRSMTSGAVLCAFDFSDQTLGAAGTSEEFIIFDGQSGPLVVSRGAEPFRRRLNQHQNIKEAAQRTVSQGPYPLYLDVDKAAVFGLTPEGLRIKGQDFELNLPSSAITKLACQRAEGGLQLRLLTKTDAMTVVGQQDILQSFNAALKARLVEAGAQDIETMSKAILGLEGDFFTYSIFGPFYELNQMLSELRATSDGDIALPNSEDMEHCIKLSALLTQGAAQLLRHLNMVLHYLPSLAAACDSDLCAGLGEPGAALSLRKQQEGRLRKAFYQLGNLQAEVQKMHTMLVNRTGLHLSSQDSDYGAVAISLLGASLFSPIFLLGGAQNAYNTYKRGAQNQQLRNENLYTTLEYVIGRWNELIREYLPLVSYHLMEEVFPARIALAKALTAMAKTAAAEQQALLRTRLSRRLAVLDTFLRYYANPGAVSTRGEIVRTIRATRHHIHYPAFRPF